MNKAADDRKSLSGLEELVKQYGTIKPGGVALDLTQDPAGWDSQMRALGQKQACAEIAGLLCRAFREANGRDLIFTEDCVAYELSWHISAFLWTQGFRGYHRPVAALPFSRASLARHCGTVEVDEKDVRDLRQRLVFHYKKGLRK